MSDEAIQHHQACPAPVAPMQAPPPPSDGAFEFLVDFEEHERVLGARVFLFEQGQAYRNHDGNRVTYAELDFDLQVGLMTYHLWPIEDKAAFLAEMPKRKCSDHDFGLSRKPSSSVSARPSHSSHIDNGGSHRHTIHQLPAQAFSSTAAPNYPASVAPIATPPQGNNQPSTTSEDRTLAATIARADRIRLADTAIADQTKPVEGKSSNLYETVRWSQTSYALRRSQPAIESSLHASKTRPKSLSLAMSDDFNANGKEGPPLRRRDDRAKVMGHTTAPSVACPRNLMKTNDREVSTIGQDAWSGKDVRNGT